MELVVRELTADLWPALEDLFGPTGAVGGCWCMYWRIGNEYRKRPRDENRAAFKRIIDEALLNERGSRRWPVTCRSVRSCATSSAT
jgi:hypothetical protein